MNIWLPPFRVCIVKRDKLLLQSFKLAVDGNKDWETIQAETLWECCLISYNCGLHVGVFDNLIPENDISIESFQEFRFFHSARNPLTLLYMKSTYDEGSNQYNFPLLKKLKSAGMINQLKSDLSDFMHESNSISGSIYSRYIQLQEEVFVRAGSYEFGEIIEKVFTSSNVYLTKSLLNIENKKFNASIEELEANISEDKHFYYAMLARLYYFKGNKKKSRKYLDKFISFNILNPLYTFIAFRIAEEFNDQKYMFCLLNFLEMTFPYSYPTVLAAGLWNIQNGKISHGVLQLLSCLEKLPWDYYVSEKIMKVLKKQGFVNLSTSVKNYALSMTLKTKFYKQLYPEFFENL